MSSNLLASEGQEPLSARDRSLASHTGTSDPDPKLIKLIESVCVRKLQPVIDNIRDMLIDHEINLSESYLTLSKLAEKYKE